MKRIYEGKTKDVFLADDGNVVLEFKDTVTGYGDRVDPGANAVIGALEGKGHASFRLTLYFCHLLEQAGIPTHFVGVGPRPNTIVAKKARSLDLEVICRRKAWGSFVRRYERYASEGMELPSLIEFSIKDDEKGDPFVTEEAMTAIGIATREQIRFMKDAARQATAILATHLAGFNLELVDIKYEFGEVQGQTMIIDEISGDSMRVLRDGKVLLQKELAAAVLGEQGWD